MHDAQAEHPAILALDLATRVGWALVEPTAVAAWPVGLLGAAGPVDGVICGSFLINEGKGPRGRKGISFSRWLDDMLSSHQVGVVAMESPVLSRTMDAARIAYGLAFLVELVSAHRDCAVIEVAPATVKKHFAGNGRADKTQMIERCRQRGWSPADADAADALAVADWAVHAVRSGRRPATPKHPKRAAKRAARAA